MRTFLSSTRRDDFDAELPRRIPVNAAPRNTDRGCRFHSCRGRGTSTVRRGTRETEYSTSSNSTDPAGLALEVVDPSGAFMPNAQIVIRSETTGKEILRETDAPGELRIADLAPGSYEITVAARYFTTAKPHHLSVPTKEIVKVRLDLGALMGEVVEVQGIETESSLVPSTLVEPAPAKSQPMERPPHRHNLFQKLISGMRRVF